MWGATYKLCEGGIKKIFQSTLPVWGATLGLPDTVEIVDISIHAPRVGSDQVMIEAAAQTMGISIHAPRVGSDDGTIYALPQRFISIHAPRVGSDCVTTARRRSLTISIHAPRVGSDCFFW